MVTALDLHLMWPSTLCVYVYRYATNGENRSLVTNEPVEFEKQPVEVENLGRTTNHSRGGIYRMYLALLKKVPNNHMEPFGVGSAWILTDYARESVRIRYRCKKQAEPTFHIPSWHYHSQFESLQGVGTAGKNKERPPSRSHVAAAVEPFCPRDTTTVVNF